MKKIWKYDLGSTPANIVCINIPQGAKILVTNVQHSRFTLWVEIDTEASFVFRNFIIYATGEPFLSEDYMKEAKYIGTVFYDALVWHVYDLGEVE